MGVENTIRIFEPTGCLSNAKVTASPNGLWSETERNWPVRSIVACALIAANLRRIVRARNAMDEIGVPAISKCPSVRLVAIFSESPS